MKLTLGIVGLSASTVHASQPLWGCGLLGPMPGINSDGTASAQAQKMIDGLKSSSSFGKVNYWNWDLAPMRNDGGSMQWLTKDFIFMPENWGMGSVPPEYVRDAGKANFLDSEGHVCPATMADIFLGGNEPDIIGSCMGNMMGKCTGSCTADEVRTGCPVAKLDDPTPADPLPNGHCDCWSQSHATGVGYWPFAGCADAQPLPALFNDTGCVDAVMNAWRKTAATVAQKGYKYLSTPLVAVDMDWIERFVVNACRDCSDISCGCPTHVGWHFYAADCRPTELGGYEDFQMKLDRTKQLMEQYPFLQGAIINEVGMLNCNMRGGGVCIPNGSNQKYPANQQKDHACPSTDELPNGLGSFVGELIDMVIKTGTTKDGRHIAAGFSWFNEDMAGGTYNLQLFDSNGNVNAVGDSYIAACKKWGQHLGLDASPVTVLKHNISHHIEVATA